MKNKIKDEVRLRHIYDAIISIEKFIINKGLDEFLEDEMFQSACIHQLEIIGEAASHFTKEFFKQYDFIEWAEIVGMRNFLIHEYFGVDLQIVWQVIQNDLPQLKSKIMKIFYDMNII